MFTDQPKRTGSTINRRQLLKVGLLASVVCLNPLSAWARFSLSGSEVRCLSLYNTHTGETLRKVAYWEQGVYLKDALSVINVLLRDHRADSVKPIDPGAIDLLFALQDKFDCQCPIEIISVYRSPETNAKMSRKSRGNAKRSYHMQGKANVLRIHEVPLRKLRQAAFALVRGGVGYYPRSNFVHVDTGPVRRW